jgi:RimJ/RimL family protein N-acetyltransferase
MIAPDLFRGELVYLSAAPREIGRQKWYQSQRNTVYQRYLDTEPTMLWSLKKLQEWQEKDDENLDQRFSFDIFTCPDKRLIGFLELFVSPWSHQDAWVGIGIGSSDDWSHGYGTDAMGLALRYAFTELNVHRVSLDVFSYNPRALRSYEKAGFRYEGRQRQVVHRDGEWTDIVFMGILRTEWLARQAATAGQGSADGG